MPASDDGHLLMTEDVTCKCCGFVLPDLEETWSVDIPGTGKGTNYVPAKQVQARAGCKRDCATVG